MTQSEMLASTLTSPIWTAHAALWSLIPMNNEWVMARALHHLFQTWFGRVALAVYSTWRNTAAVNAPVTDGSVTSAFFFPPRCIFPFSPFWQPPPLKQRYMYYIIIIIQLLSWQPFSPQTNFARRECHTEIHTSTYPPRAPSLFIQTLPLPSVETTAADAWKEFWEVYNV